MKSAAKFFVPLIFVVAGLDVFLSKSDEPYSSTIPIVFGEHKEVAGGSLVAIGLLLAICVAAYLRKDKK